MARVNPDKIKISIAKSKQTKLAKYGDENYNNRNKAIETCLKLYGVDNPRKSAKIKDKIKETKLEKYGDENYNNMDKYKQTCLEKYGVEYTSVLSEMKEKVKQTKLAKYGDENYNNRNKAIEMCLKLYGVTNPSELPETKAKVVLTNLERYGCIYALSNRFVINKRYGTKLEKYGDEKYNNIKKSKQTKLAKYGDENYNNRNKAIETCLKLYGVDNIMRLKYIIERILITKLERYGALGITNPLKYKETCLSRYGVDNVMKIPEIFYKAQSNKYKRKSYTLPSNKIITLQGYEPQFLDNYFNSGGNEDHLNYTATTIPCISYEFKGKLRKYYPDFYNNSTNTLIEIKSRYTYNKDLEMNIAKFNAAVSYGYELKVYILDGKGKILECVNQNII